MPEAVKGTNGEGSKEDGKKRVVEEVSNK